MFQRLSAISNEKTMKAKRRDIHVTFFFLSNIGKPMHTKILRRKSHSHYNINMIFSIHNNYHALSCTNSKWFASDNVKRINICNLVSWIYLLNKFRNYKCWEKSLFRRNKGLVAYFHMHWKNIWFLWVIKSQEHKYAYEYNVTDAGNCSYIQ